jgi:hypothetical protein
VSWRVKRRAAWYVHVACGLWKWNATQRCCGTRCCTQSNGSWRYVCTYLPHRARFTGWRCAGDSPLIRSFLRLPFFHSGVCFGTSGLPFAGARPDLCRSRWNFINPLHMEHVRACVRERCSRNVGWCRCVGLWIVDSMTRMHTCSGVSLDA